MTIEVLHERGCANRAIARTLDVDEKAVRYRLRRLRERRPDGRAGKARRADAVAEAIGHWMATRGERVNLAALHAWLLQAYTDTELAREAKRRRCPATGESVWESWQQEKHQLAALPLLPEPFDLVAQRRVGIDATLRFEGRTYSVPFAYVERPVEVRGCARVVQVLCEGRVVAEHPRHTRALVVLDPLHYDGDSTDRVQAPVPLGRMGRRLQEIAAMAPEQRPIHLYAALAEVAR